MKVLLNIRENLVGGYDADYYAQGLDENDMPIGDAWGYTLSDEDIAEADLSTATLLDQSVKDDYAAQQAQELINTESKAYLASTDWYVIRFNEIAKPIPQDILDARQAARDAII